MGSLKTNFLHGKKFRNCPVKTSISKWWECTAILYSSFNRGNDHFITLLSYSKQNTMGPGSQFEKLQSSFWFRPWRTNTKVLLGNIITEFYFQLMAPNTKDTNNYCMHIPLYESSSHDSRQRFQNLGHTRSDNYLVRY